MLVCGGGTGGTAVITVVGLLTEVMITVGGGVGTTDVAGGGFKVGFVCVVETTGGEDETT